MLSSHQLQQLSSPNYTTRLCLRLPEEYLFLQGVLFGHWLLQQALLTSKQIPDIKLCMLCVVIHA